MFDYIVVQAGGKGSRLKKLTQNKPKALVSINNLPMIFHLFKRFPDKKFVIIGDYKYDVLEKYLKAFAKVDYKLVCGTGHIGTCAGLGEALENVPADKPFMLIWSDLVLGDGFVEPTENKNYVGLSQEFPCRWRYHDRKFEEISSSDEGVAGLFIFKNKSILADTPIEGEFVRYLSTKNIDFDSFVLPKTQEYGLFDIVNNLDKPKCRPFNSILVKDGKLIKTPLDKQGFDLAKHEVNWYRFINEKASEKINIPKIYNYEPLIMDFIGDGTHLYKTDYLSREQKIEVLKSIVDSLDKIHKLGSTEADYESFVDAYLIKTMKRLEKVKDLVPFAKDEFVIVNSKKCHNIFYCLKEISKDVFDFFPDKFCAIHGDCTFSNMMLDKNFKPILIDPRGYFGKVEIFGDEAYDWAKVYYSVVGNYDQFNLGKFDLKINENDVTLSIESNGYEDLEYVLLELLKGKVFRKQLLLYHMIIWYSLTTYAWNDYDSICGAFYKGCEVLEEYLEEKNK